MGLKHCCSTRSTMLRCHLCWAEDYVKPIAQAASVYSTQSQIKRETKENCFYRCLFTVRLATAPTQHSCEERQEDPEYES